MLVFIALIIALTAGSARGADIAPTISAGEEHFCVLDAEGAKCWGRAFRDVGDRCGCVEQQFASPCAGYRVDPAAAACALYDRRVAPERVRLPDVASLWTGWETSCIAADATGTLQCWGNDAAQEAARAVWTPYARAMTLAEDVACALGEGGLTCKMSDRLRTRWTRNWDGLSEQVYASCKEPRVWDLEADGARVDAAAGLFRVPQYGVCAVVQPAAPDAPREIRCRSEKDLAGCSDRDALDHAPVGWSATLAIDAVDAVPARTPFSGPLFYALHREGGRFLLSMLSLEYPATVGIRQRVDYPIGDLAAPTDLVMAEQPVAGGSGHHRRLLCVLDSGRVPCYDTVRRERVELPFAGGAIAIAGATGGVCAITRDWRVACYDLATGTVEPRPMIVNPGSSLFALASLDAALLLLADSSYAATAAVLDAARALVPGAQSELERFYLLKAVRPLVDAASSRFFVESLQPAYMRRLQAYERDLGGEPPRVARIDAALARAALHELGYAAEAAAVARIMAAGSQAAALDAFFATLAPRRPELEAAAAAFGPERAVALLLLAQISR